jgi:hypothetical protein
MHYFREMKFFVTGLMCVWLVSCTTRTDRIVVELNFLLDSLQMEFAPDSRVAYWEMDITASDRVILNGEVANKDAYSAISTALGQRFPEVKNQVELLPKIGSGSFVNGLVNNSVAHLRKDPSSKKELVTQALLGHPVRILKDENEKFLIQTADGYLGWVNRSEVYLLDAEQLEDYRNSEKVVFKAQHGFSYSEPNETSMPVADLVPGCILPVISKEADFIQVVYPDGRLAWLKKLEVLDLNTIINGSLMYKGILQTAVGYHGIPYLWGGASAKALDCSGLMCNVFFLNGVVLPRDADMQSHCGRIVTENFSQEELEPGDLMFFGRKATGTDTERVTHVALYMGNGEYIHAAGYRDRVGINSMDSTHAHYIPDFPEIFVRATRIIGEPGIGFEPIKYNKFYKEIIRITE